jgi:hypothetical protein
MGTGHPVCQEVPTIRVRVAAPITEIVAWNAACPGVPGGVDEGVEAGGGLDTGAVEPRPASVVGPAALGAAPRAHAASIRATDTA